MKHLVAFIIGAEILVACAPPAILTPPVDPAMPCGAFGVECRMQHTCCDEGYTCGGEPTSVGCPAGACCFIGEPTSSGMGPTTFGVAGPQKPLSK
jgi:hypothetical protein